MDNDDNWKEDYDWKEAFASEGADTSNGKMFRKAVPNSEVSLEPFTIDNVVEVIKMVEGENDGESWLMLGKLNDNRWFLLDAWCDYTGWGCQSGGSVTLAASKEELLQYGLTTEDKTILGV